MTDGELWLEYQRREEIEGGAEMADAHAIIRAIADEHGVPYEQVRDVVSARFAMMGAG